MSEDELYRARLGKAEALRASGIEPWAVRFDRTHLAAALHAEHAGLEPGGSSGITVRIAGRLMTTREQGKLAFGDLVDGSGKIQLFVGGDQVLAFSALDTGDLIGIEGEVVRTKRGELSVRPSELVLLAKALRPLPDKWHGLRDVEVRYRQRYLDLIANPQAREIALMRPRVIRALRAFLDERDFVEVETPILHPIPSGAAARPFSTHYNALDADFYLRVAPELYLKRLVVGGLERVYEIGRTFRNEGVSYKYNPEFTMLEAYQAYADYLDVMELVQGLLQDVATEALGRTAVTFEGEEIELGGDWTRVRMLDLVSETIGREVSFEMPVDDLRAEAAKRDVEVQPWWGHGMLIAELYDKVAEPRIIQPTIVYDYPLDISPLARTHREDPNLTERFEVVVAGRELGNAFSELNDPIEQRRRFELQMQARDHGDVEASPMDEPYVSALEYGLPPTGGFGIGVDRFVMLLAGVHSIREVILFPALRPEA
jgi:lysyl-tRNA synthetase class 2